jgi:long-chain fatty acid transport protein
MRRTSTVAVIAALSLLISTDLLASGIELQEQDAAAQARALAVRALLDNPSVLFYNPAGLGYFEGLGLSLGDTLVFPRFNYSDPNAREPKASNENKAVAPPHAYVAVSFEPHKTGRLGFGLGFNYPFGLTLRWPDSFAGRHLVTESALQIPEILLSVGYSPVKYISIGAAFVASPASVYLKRYLGSDFGLVGGEGNPGRDDYVEMKGSGWGFGANVGIQARPTRWLTLGFVYRSAITLDMEGDAHFELSDSLLDRSVFHDQGVETSFKLPHIFALGIGLKFGRWYGEIDVDYTLWSVFEEIPLRFPEDASDQLSQSIPEHWKNTWTIRTGHEIAVWDTLKVRVGGGYDQNPVKDEYLTPMLPDSDRIFLSLGLGYKFQFGLTIDLAYMFTYFLPRKVEGHACSEADTDHPECFEEDQVDAFDGDGSANWVGNRFPASYKSQAHLLALTLGIRF